MNAQYEPEGEQLTEAAALRRLAGGAVFVLFFGALAWHEWSEKKLTWVAFYGAAAFVRACALSALWKQHQFVRSGGAVYLSKPTAQESVISPTGWALVFLVVVLFALTALAAGVGFVCIMLLRGTTQWAAWTIAGAVNIGLWLYVVHCWRRVLFPTPQAVQTVKCDEPQEGIWPPPPQRPT